MIEPAFSARQSLLIHENPGPESSPQKSFRRSRLKVASCLLLFETVKLEAAQEIKKFKTNLSCFIWQRPMPYRLTASRCTFINCHNFESSPVCDPEQPASSNRKNFASCAGHLSIPLQQVKRSVKPAPLKH